MLGSSVSVGPLGLKIPKLWMPRVRLHTPEGRGSLLCLDGSGFTEGRGNCRREARAVCLHGCQEPEDLGSPLPLGESRWRERANRRRRHLPSPGQPEGGPGMTGPTHLQPSGYALWWSALITLWAIREPRTAHREEVILKRGKGFPRTHSKLGQPQGVRRRPAFLTPLSFLTAFTTPICPPTPSFQPGW